MKNSKYKVLLLDYGGVYSFEYKFGDFNKSIESLFGVNLSTVSDIDFAGVNDSFGAGLISTEEYINKLSVLFDANKKPTKQDLEDELLRTTFVPSIPMVELVSDVKNQGIKVGLLSDICDFEIPYIQALGGYDGFDVVLLSAKAGITKNNPDFFQLALDEFKAKSSEVLFVDDRQHIIEVAKSLGFDTLLADKNLYATSNELSSKIRLILVITPAA